MIIVDGTLPYTHMAQLVILSNLSEKQDIEKGLRLGALDFFVKSNHAPNEIVEKVE